MRIEKTTGVLALAAAFGGVATAVGGDAIGNVGDVKLKGYLSEQLPLYVDDQGTMSTKRIYGKNTCIVVRCSKMRDNRKI